MTDDSELVIAVDLGTDLMSSERQVRDGLSAEGFGVLTEIDIQATMKTTLQVDMPGYRILGACNPALAHRAITADASVGLLLPCNVVLREVPSGTRVEFANPMSMLQLVDNADVREVAADAHARIKRVVQQLSLGGPAVSATAALA